MKRFRFRLESVLRWRQTLEGIEQEKLRNLNARLHDLERARAEIEQLRRRLPGEVARRSGVSGAELAALDAYLRRLGAIEEELRQQRVQLHKQVEAQQQAVLEARRKVRLLERLKARRLADWQAELARETERVAADNYLARWRRQ
ncbi:MAG: flagellar FliJ family protein [Bryobacterales bacterium]|nr:flagellar FliJ family protein [Bryobacteraceae bacterium]MDW8354488.1 flagellar FliJ family protein [Bryobacterales bacterium]